MECPRGTVKIIYDAKNKRTLYNIDIIENPTCRWRQKERSEKIKSKKKKNWERGKENKIDTIFIIYFLWSYIKRQHAFLTWEKKKKKKNLKMKII